MINLSRRKALTLAAAAALAPAASSAFAETAEKKGTKDMPMRNQKFALTREETLDVIRRTDHAVLSLADGTGEPYGVPITPILLDGKIYFHGAGMGDGRRNADIQQNPRGSICWIAQDRTNQPKLSVDFVSAIASGPIRIIKDKEGKNFVNQAPFSFDLSVMDLYTSLACGGTLHTMTKKMQEDYNAMFEHFKQSDINVWVSTPSFADMCLSDRKFSGELIPNLEVFLFCGEVLTTATVSKLHQRFPKAKVINTYGPTESTVAVTDIEITPELLENIISQGKSLPVGHEKKGTIIEIHGEQGEILEEGQQGEIIIIGDTVSTGYYKRDDLTKKAFFQCERNGIKYRAYHTGDAGYLKEGQLFYNGRIDLQVKLHGYRIEVEDIENNMLRLPQISHAVVLPNMKDGKVKSLTAFVTGDKGEKSDLEFSRQIKTELKEIIPAYMVPKKIKYVDNIPMNSNGKADRKYLGGLL